MPKRRLPRRVDVRAEEEEFPAVARLLPLDHAPHRLVIIAAAGVFIAVGRNDEQRPFRHVLTAGIFVHIADVADRAAQRVEQRRAAARVVFPLRQRRDLLERQTVMDDRACVVKEHRGDQRRARLPLLLRDHRVEAADRVRRQRRHRAAAIQK